MQIAHESNHFLILSVTDIDEALTSDSNLHTYYLGQFYGVLSTHSDLKVKINDINCQKDSAATKMHENVGFDGRCQIEFTDKNVFATYVADLQVKPFLTTDYSNSKYIFKSN